MAAAFVPSYRVLSTTSLSCEVVFSGADVAGGSILAAVTVTGIDFLNDTANTITGKIATAVRAASADFANGSAGRGFTIGANNVTMPGFTKG